jgi:hypothetical protein
MKRSMPKAKRKPATLQAAPTWQFNQEALAEKYATSKDVLASTVLEEASRCLNAIAYTAELAVEEIPSAVKNVARHLLLLDRPYRWGVLITLLEEFEDCAVIFWPLLMHWWVDGESNCNRGAVPLIKRAIEWEGGRLPHDFMWPEDKSFFDALPATVTIYRGIQRPGRHIGISWTTDRKKAEWFAQRFAFGEKKPVLLTGRVRKLKIIACFTGRNESEVLVLAKHVRGRKEEELPPRWRNASSRKFLRD